MRRDEPAEHFGVAIDRLTGKVRRIFNPDHEWEFAFHHVDDEYEYIRMERKEDWGVPLKPNSMTLDMAYNIQKTIDRGSNLGDA
jgi:hypothetical protein